MTPGVDPSPGGGTDAEIAWVANLATGRARCLHRHFKGAEYARAMDMLDGVPYTPVCDRAGAVLHARALVELAQAMLTHLEVAS